MPLIVPTLKTSLQAIQAAHPSSTDQASQQWALAVFIYCSTAVAGSVLPMFNIGPLIGSFRSSLDSSTFIDDLGNNLLNWFLATPWVGPGFTGQTLPTTPMASAAIGKKILNDHEDPADILSREIDQWVKSVNVLLTNSSTGATLTAPIS